MHFLKYKLSYMEYLLELCASTRELFSELLMK